MTTMNKQASTVPTIVSRRVLARAITTAAPAIQSKKSLGAAAEWATEEASGSASMLLEEEAEVTTNCE